MTKLKSKKMTKSTFAIIIMAIIMVAMLAFGGTYAYFTATSANADSTASTGTVLLGANSAVTLTSNVVSTQELLPSGGIGIVNKSNVETYVFVTFTASCAGGTLGTNKDSLTADQYFLEYAVDSTIWTALDSTNAPNVYWAKLSASTTDNSTATNVCSSIKFYGNSNSVNGTAGTLMGKTVTVSVASESIQAEGFTHQGAAYKAMHSGYQGATSNT